MSQDIFDKLKAPFDPALVHFRVGAVSKNKDKAIGLAYLDARDVMERLDAVCGPDGWSNSYSHADNKTVCEISILCTMEDGKKHWVSKADGAGDSSIEAQKGALSDAFKRAAVRWGIGRYLYNMPNVWVEIDEYKRFTDGAMRKLRTELKRLSDQSELSVDPTQVKKSSAQAKRDGDYERLKEDMFSQGKPEHLQHWGQSNAEEIAKLPTKWQDVLRGEYAEHMKTLEQLMEPL